MKNSNNELIQVAYYYYKLNLTQQEIAKKMGISRQKVNRLIQKAVQENIVEIKINGYENFDIDLEYLLEKKYGLHKAIVVKDNLDEKPIGIASSDYLNQIVDSVLDEKKDCKIGISWGQSLRNMTSNYNKSPQVKGSISVIQLCGGINNAETSIKPEEITNELAMILNGTSHNLYAPAKMENRELVRLLKQESYYRNILEQYDGIDVSVVGIGNLDSDGTLVKYKYLDDQTFLELSNLGAVGDVCFRMFNENGILVESDYNEMIMGISMESYLRIPHRVGIAYGDNKARAIRAALCGEIINVLVTDHHTAKMVLSEQDS